LADIFFVGAKTQFVGYLPNPTDIGENCVGLCKKLTYGHSHFGATPVIRGAKNIVKSRGGSQSNLRRTKILFRMSRRQPAKVENNEAGNIKTRPQKIGTNKRHENWLRIVIFKTTLP
jgi:hypothetical protein